MNISIDESWSMPAVKYAGLSGKTWDGLLEKFKDTPIVCSSDVHFGTGVNKIQISLEYLANVKGMVSELSDKVALKKGKGGDKSVSVVKPKGLVRVFPKVLENPRSEWGKMLKATVEGKNKKTS